MTTPQQKAMALEDERTAQKIYRRVLHTAATTPLAVSGPANLQWTGDGLPRTRRIDSGDLVGRVALVRADQDLLDGGSDFYIGASFAKIDETYVYGWSNPIAATFFRGSGHHYLCKEVAVVRSLDVQNGRVEDFVDEVVRRDAPLSPFRKRGLSIPAPPKPLTMPAPRPAPDTMPAVTRAMVGSTQEERLDTPEPETDNPKLQPTSLPPLRAENLLRQRLIAPRTKSLAPVLSTLQPDQYDLVTAPAMDSIIIEGHPGTGKTIIAAHRAAYLVDDETPPESTLDGTVLVVGPTAGYSRHVRDVIGRLAGSTGRIKVMSLPELINHIIGVNLPPRSHRSRSWQDVDWQLVKFVRSALNKIRSARPIALHPEQVYEHLRANAGLVTREEEWARYLANLPPYREAVVDGIHGVLVAFIKWEVSKPFDLSLVEHVIVDEAQDVTPLEWLLLDEINVADAWTIFGDLNQRRSDHTLPSWDQVLDVIAIDPDTPVKRLQRGYRSTRPILEFANRLLPRAERVLYALQDEGPRPTVRKLPPNELSGEVVREVERLLGIYSAGTVAVIGSDPSLATKGLRAQGWTASRLDPHAWERDKRQVSVMDIDEARGLEFDAVLVIEPADFPENIGRQGPLYTALTRANRELSVLYSRSLPDRLKR